MGKLANGSTKAIGAKGPINAMIGAADEIGWTMRDPVTLVDQKGELIYLTTGSPARLRKLIHQAIAHKLEVQFMDKLIEGGTGTDSEFAGARLRKIIHRAIAQKLEEQFMAKLIKGGTGTDSEFAGARLRGLNLKPLRRTLA